MLEAVHVHPEAKGLRIATGTIVDATILHAPLSTKNATGERDPEMHRTRKGSQWNFGLKAHIGLDLKQGTVHAVAPPPLRLPTSTGCLTRCAVKRPMCAAMEAIRGRTGGQASRA